MRGDELHGVKYTLISARAEETESSLRIRSDQLSMSPPAPWSLERDRLTGGRQEGVELMTLDNGRIKIRVIPTRGMGILDLQLGDWRVGWDSPVREIVHPQFINLQSRGGLGWLEGFNEWLVRCGLEWAGAPGTDRFINNNGDEAEMELTLHGRIANIPASRVWFEAENVAPHRLRLSGTVEETMLFGPNLELATEIETRSGSSQLRITDRITNRAARSQEFQLLYHVNIGRPLLGEGSRLFGSFTDVHPINARAAENLANFDRYQGPEVGFVEQVYCMKAQGDRRGLATAVLTSPEQDRGILLRFPVDRLPCFSLWKNLAAEEDGYVTGLEPATGFPNNRRQERQSGRVPVLQPGETRSFELHFDLLEGEEQVQAAIKAF